MLSLWLRSHRYLSLHADPGIGCRTHFFAAAASVTRALARHRFSSFLLELGATLETANVLRAQQISDGRLYAAGTITDNTRDFVVYEQGIVQRHLDALRRSRPHRYTREVRCANAAFRLLRFRALRAVADRCFVQAVDYTTLQRAGPIDIADRSCREVLGLSLAYFATAAGSVSAAASC